MLSKTKRKEYMGDLGFTYDSKGIKTFQKKFMYKVTGKYDAQTDNAVVTAWRLHKYGKGYFIPTEFRCKCGGKYCNGFPAAVDAQLIKSLAYLREDSKKPVKITSGLRCKTWNAKQSGSASQSRHMMGKAVDFYSDALTRTKELRNKMVKRWYTFKRANYSYANTPNMGNVVHVDVK